MISFIIMIFYYGYSLTNNNIFNHLLAYAHILPGTPNALFIEKDGYQIGFLSYPNNPKVNAFTLLNLNVQQNGTDVGNTYGSLIIMDKNTKKIVHQVPYKFYVFADMSYPYIFKNDGEYSLSLLTKISGDEKYENNPLIATFDLSTEGASKNDNINSIIIYSLIASVVAVTLISIICLKKKKIKLNINKKSKSWNLTIIILKIILKKYEEMSTKENKKSFLPFSNNI